MPESTLSPIHRNTVRARIKSIIGRIKNWPVASIKADLRLREDLRFQPAGLRGLRGAIIEHFAGEFGVDCDIPVEDFLKLKTVGEVINAVYGKVTQ